MPTKLFYSLTETHKAALKSALAAASLTVTAVEGGGGGGGAVEGGGGLAASPTESTHVAANRMQVRLKWSTPPSPEELAAASAIVAAYAWS